MANRRMISKSISVSEQANELSDFAALLFTWMLPHTDDWGVIVGSAKKIKYLVVPMRSQTPDEVEAALCEMQQAGLIWRYIYKDEQHLQYIRFDNHQDGLHKRTNPKHPTFLTAQADSENFRELPGNSHLTEPNLTEPNLNEQNLTEPKGTSLRGNTPSVDNVDNFDEEPIYCDPEGIPLKSSSDAWLEVISNFGNREPKWSNPFIKAAVKALGGIGVIGQSKSGSMIMQFIDVYRGLLHKAYTGG